MPLMKAVLCGNLQVVTFLLENGCVPKEDDYLMHMLAESSDYSARIEDATLPDPSVPEEDQKVLDLFHRVPKEKREFVLSLIQATIDNL